MVWYFWCRHYMNERSCVCSSLKRLISYASRLGIDYFDIRFKWPAFLLFKTTNVYTAQLCWLNVFYRVEDIFLNERVESESGKSDGFSMYAADYHNECVEEGWSAGMIVNVPSSRIDYTKPWYVFVLNSIPKEIVFLSFLEKCWENFDFFPIL